MLPDRPAFGRFECLRLAGAGGMGQVFEARDLHTGARVALKLLREAGALGEERFAREIRALAGLRQPGVVRYVAHGATPEGEPYLAMEWIDGETLSARLRRGPLDVAEAVALAARLAEALGAVHRAGVVHRDLKPSNILLAGGSLDQPVLVDFGLARLPGAARLTHTGAALGTPGYMSPEQARGEPDIDARTDVFALGCVLFRCLTGEAAFVGKQPLAVMLRLLLEEPPRVRDLKPDVPHALDALVARLLSKPRDGRPSDGYAVVEEIEALGVPSSVTPASRRTAGPSSGEITASERRLICLLLVRDAAADLEARALRAVAERHHGRMELLADGTLLVTLASADVPTDLCARAARCALALRAVLGEAPIAVAAGWAEVEARVPVGEVSDRAVHLLEAAGQPDAASMILTDKTTARLLGPQFDVRLEGEAYALYGERDEADAAPLLLGRPTHCVGRDRELAILEATLTHCVEDSVAAVAFVTGSAGMGKSRLRQELLRRLRARGEPLDVWIAQGDPMGAGAAFGLLARAVRHALGMGEADLPAARQRRILARVAGLPEADRVAAFLGELTGAPFTDDANAQLRAARRDPQLMGDQLRWAAEDLLRAACSAQPVVLVLEDLQWGDLPSVTFVEAALRNLDDQPLMVLALARPEVHGVFPDLWSRRTVQVLQLGTLPRRAAERMVRLSLGDAVPAEQVQMLVERADGNAFYLEELIRAVADGQGERLPETLLAMAQTRIERLDAEARRILRAASIFGRTFSKAGVEALLGGSPAGHRLDELVNREVLVRRFTAEGTGIGEYEFRHALLREAVYAMLTDGDRALGHQLAGAWLEREGQGDAMALAEHFERGKEPERAAVWYCRASEEALQGNDLIAALARAERGVACNAGQELLGLLRLVQAEAHVWRGELSDAEARAGEAAALLPPGSAAWYRAMAQATLAAGKLGAADRIEAWVGPTCSVMPAEDAASSLVVYLAYCAWERLLRGDHSGAAALLEHAHVLASNTQDVDAQAVGVLQQAYAMCAVTKGDLPAGLRAFEDALAAFERAGDRRNLCSGRMNLGFTLAELGDLAEAEQALRAALTDAQAMGVHQLIPSIQQNLGYALLHAGQLDEARRLQEEAIETLRHQGHPRMEGVAHTYLARIELLSGNAAAAEREARAAAALLEVAPPVRAAALALLARALLAQGRVDEAQTPAQEAFAQLQVTGSLEEGEALVRLVYAEALEAAGQRREAAEARAAARSWLLARAEKIGDPAWRERFMTQLRDHAAILATPL